jgi:FtsZ-binding cell division protein ZapB
MNNEKSIDIPHILIGVLIGVQLTGLIVVLSKDNVFDMALLVNITISLAAIVAIIVQVFAIKLSKKEREWNIIKDIVLPLTKSISEVIEGNRLIIYAYHHDRDHTLGPYNGPLPKLEIFQELNAKIKEAIDVYSMILDKEIIDKLVELLKEINMIDEAVGFANLEDDEACNLKNDLLSKMHIQLNTLMSRYVK